MRIRLKVKMAGMGGFEGVRPAGEIVDVPDSKGRELIARGLAQDPGLPWPPVVSLPSEAKKIIRL